ncbi:coxsackievirus and adenovirus receptor-like isoform X1 [Micropterus salmoides]|uniref:coxsackievirus and adenovirus receptor-like isoform X1 n=1 Tax=Micropterus salmoides TaxID=27706 RepID=UPI0018ED244E|nr:coxsackievirus and adenovirus receptor-like isoform X1 [Micropterus salmoides]
MVYLFVFLLARLSPASSDVVRVKPGDDVILPCRADEASIRAVEWSIADLESEYVLFNRDGLSDPTHQHPCFKDRVQLVDRELKDGDVSLILKNVSRNDAGTYECRVAAGGSRRKRAIIETEPIRIIQLEVSGEFVEVSVSVCHVVAAVYSMLILRVKHEEYRRYRRVNGSCGGGDDFIWK